MSIRPNIQLIETVSAELRDMLGDEFDAETFWDTLDGETDATDIVDRLIASMLDDESLAVAAKSHADEIAARAKRIAERAAAKKQTILTVLEATGEKKMERPLATVSRRAGGVSLRITDENAIPSQLTKTTVAPDKAAIKAQLQAGESVPGAELVRGDDTISVRVK